MQEFKLIVAGGRDFSDTKMLEKAITDLAEGDYADKAVSIVSGMVRGTKQMIDYMRKLGKPVHVIPY